MQAEMISFLPLENPHTRDFRYSCAIHYHPTDLMVNEQVSKFKIPTSKQGWRASYVELDFPDGLRAAHLFLYLRILIPKKIKLCHHNECDC